jgi:uncharacterized protein
MTPLLARREHHRFQAAGKPFVYLVASAAIFALDDTAAAVMVTLDERPHTREELLEALSDRHAQADLEDTLAELARIHAIGEVVELRRDATPLPRIIPLAPFPLTTMVLNVTNQCNLSCSYCYEYSEDKIVDTENGRKQKVNSE